MIFLRCFNDNYERELGDEWVGGKMNGWMANTTSTMYISAKS
jgi:hypothetical protein